MDLDGGATTAVDGFMDEVHSIGLHLGAGGRLANEDDVVRGAGPLLLGALGFSSEPAVSEQWRGFETADVALPEFLVTTTPDGTWLTTSLVVSEAEDKGATVEAVVATWRELDDAVGRDTPAQAASDVLRVMASRPEAPEWRATVARFAGAVGRGRLDKVVLARQIDVRAESSIDLEALLRRLVAAAPESTVFAIARGAGTFVGATPERLVKVEGVAFETIALAGSTRRARDDEADERLAAELLSSDKEREEHAVVVEMLRDTLTPIAEHLDVPERPTVVRLRHVQHLSTEVQGRLREPTDILGLVSLLHPTPAVGGAPRALALELIAEEEGHERGWYAGPLGWMDQHGDGEFVVALRSGVIRGRDATLFAGCGIVADSDPDREWAESLTKLRALGSALGRIEA